MPARSHTPRILAEAAQALAPGRPLEQFLLWPPDLFALTSVLLMDSGVYTQCVSPPAGKKWPPKGDWSRWTSRLAAEWLRKLSRIDLYTALQNDGTWKGTFGRRRALGLVPGRLAKVWERLSASLGDQEQEALRDDWKVAEALLTLHALADEASTWFGRALSELDAEPMYLIARSRLDSEGTLALLHPSRGRVLPKYHTPQIGISPRSLSRHLAFHRGAIEVRWPGGPDVLNDPELLSCLLLPWPERITAREFSPMRVRTVGLESERYGFFHFQPEDDASEQADLLDRALTAAEAELGPIDLVVLPELAVDAAAVPALETRLFEHGVGMYVIGVRSGSADEFGSNQVHMRRRNPFFLAGESGFPAYEGQPQHKHHRWCLDRHQVEQYHLGGVLHSSRSWWEAIRIEPRTLQFASVGKDLVVCPLICEDLARQDPVADLVRAVGPSLVVALLMDGPQLASRWSARYASVLAEDPGSSVLSLSSLGMVQRSRPPGFPPSRTIALWKDSSGAPREVSIDADARAVVLSLCADPTREFSADGRRDDGDTAREGEPGPGALLARQPLRLRLGGITQIRV